MMLQTNLPTIQKENSPPSSMGDQEESSTVITLFGVALDNHEINLLSRGLSFCPTPRRANKKMILNDLEDYRIARKFGGINIWRIGFIKRLAKSKFGDFASSN